LLARGIAFAGAATTAGGTSLISAAAEPLTNGSWSLGPGVPVPPYGQPSKFEQKVVRTLSNPKLEPRGSAARTPHHLLNGTFTPNGLHFTIVHSGTPDIDPEQHRLVIHGLVKRPLAFSLDALGRYPLVSRMTFVECGGNSAPLFSPQPIQGSAQALHGLVSCAEWTGVMLSTLLEEAGVEAKAKWLVAEGADSLALSRSVPLGKALDDAMIALYQNGERLMPANGYPMRLLLPGYEGNMNIKYLRRIKLVEGPAMSYWEARSYAPLLPNGKAYQFYFRLTFDRHTPRMPAIAKESTYARC
jgi:sulfane dehydrogenase subunit SoxC